MDIKQAFGERCSEHEAASDQLDEPTNRGFNVQTVEAEKGYHTKEFVKDCRDREIEPHVALIKGRETPGLDASATHEEGYKTSQHLRKRIGENFGWMKAFGNFRKSRWIEAGKTHFVAQFVGSACNLIRMAKLSLAEANLPRQPSAA